MGMSGKTFLSAFQVGSRLYPDILKSREDQIDKKLKREMLDLQKNNLKVESEVAAAKGERLSTGLKNLEEFKVEFDALDMNSPEFVSQYSDLVMGSVIGPW